MPVSSIDFGNGVVPLSGNDVFFLDTSIIVAFLYQEDNKHLSCYSFVSYLLKNNVILCVSEVVVGEVINSLARIYYADDRFSEYMQTNTASSAQGKKQMKRQFRSKWVSDIVKKNSAQLADYNKKAINTCQAFLQGCFLIPCTETQMEKSFDIMVNTPLASADALIVSAALSEECNGLVSIDSDFGEVADVQVYQTTVTNDRYDTANMLKQLDVMEFIYDSIGEQMFREKYPTISHPIGT